MLNQCGGRWAHTCKLLFAEAERLLVRGTGSGEVAGLYQVEHRPVWIQTAMLDRENRALCFLLSGGPAKTQNPLGEKGKTDL